MSISCHLGCFPTGIEVKQKCFWIPALSGVTSGRYPPELWLFYLNKLKKLFIISFMHSLINKWFLSMCYKLSLLWSWTDNAEMEGTWRNPVSRYVNTLKTQSQKWFRSSGPILHVSELSIREMGFPSNPGQIGRKGMKDRQMCLRTRLGQLPASDPPAKARGLGTMERAPGVETKIHQGSPRGDLGSPHSTWVENSSCKSRVGKASRRTVTFVQGKPEPLLPVLGAEAVFWLLWGGLPGTRQANRHQSWHHDRSLMHTGMERMRVAQWECWRPIVTRVWIQGWQ